MRNFQKCFAPEAEIDALTRDGYRLNEPELKRVPAGYPKDHLSGDLLRRKRLHVWRETGSVELCFGEEGAERYVTEVAAFFPLFSQLCAFQR